MEEHMILFLAFLWWELEFAFPLERENLRRDGHLEKADVENKTDVGLSTRSNFKEQYDVVI